MDIDQNYLRKVALENLLTMSRTARGKLDVSASITKQESMAIRDADKAKGIAEDNYKKTIAFGYACRNQIFHSPDEVRSFLETMAQMINKGIVKDGAWIRSGADSTKYCYTRIRNLEQEMTWFYDQLYQMLTADSYDAVTAAAFAEYYINLCIHFLADGCCKTSMAFSAYLMLRGNQYPVRYDSRENYYRFASKKQVSRGSAEDQNYFQRFCQYYHTLLRNPQEDCERRS